MNSRKMERAEALVGERESQTDDADITAKLRSLLKRPRFGAPGRLLCLRQNKRDEGLGWHGLGWHGDLSLLAEEVVVSDLSGLAQLSEPSANNFDAVLWQTSTAGPSKEDLAQIQRLLTDQGRLIVHTPTALHQNALARLLVQRLSESGFVVLKELFSEELGGKGGAAALARRDDYLIRAFRDGDENAIARLFVDCFHVPRSNEHWCWKYHLGPYGNRYMSLAFSPDGQLASHYAGFPVPFWCDGRSFLGLQMGDTMTSPKFRSVGRGVSSLLARAVRHFFSIYRSGPFGFFYGFNTGGIQRFCSWFIGGSQVEPVRYLVRPGDVPVPAAPRDYRIERLTSPTRLEKASRKARAWDRFFQRVAPHYGFLVQRDAQYVDWRYLRCPDPEPYIVLTARRWGRLVGWAVFRRKDNRLIWGDALFHPRHGAAARTLLAAALATPESQGTSQVEGWFSDRPAWWNTELDQLGFEKKPQPDKLGFMILPDTEEDPPLNRLYYTMGDGDLF